MPTCWKQKPPIPPKAVVGLIGPAPSFGQPGAAFTPLLVKI